MTSDEVTRGRQANAVRGSKPFLSGRTRDSWELPAIAGDAEAKPGAMFRFTNRPYFSAIGDSYSHRTPRVSVTDDFTCQSSVTYALVNDCRKYLSAFPKAME